MLARAFAAGLTLTWVTGDSVYGADRTLRAWLEDHQQAEVLAVSGNATVWVDQCQQSITSLVAVPPDHGWVRLRAGGGSKGLRWYDWYARALSAPVQDGWTCRRLVRRNISDPSTLTTYVTFAAADRDLTDVVRVAGMRWTVEESIQTGKGEVGWDHD